MAHCELKVIDDFYKFMLWLVQHTEKFPRVHRYSLDSLGVSIKQRAQAVMALLLQAKCTKAKDEILRRINIELKVLRFPVRLATG